MSGPVALREAHAMDEDQPSSDTVWYGISWVNMGVNGTTREYCGIFRRSLQRSQCFISTDKGQVNVALRGEVQMPIYICSIYVPF